MKKVFVFVFNFLLIGNFCFSQATNTDYYQQKKEENAFKEISSRLPVLKLPSGYNTKDLPSYLDNSKLAFFPEIVNQGQFSSCQQSSAIRYDFTYEIDRSRNLPADIPSNEYPAHYTWNYLNNEGWNGSNFLFSFDVINKQGTPDIAHYGYDSVVGDKRWMNGYENYYNSMQNRIAKVNRIPLNTEEGILTAKAFLYDRLDGSPTGGVFTFNASSPWNYKHIPQGIPEAGKCIMVNWLSPASHGMTVVGYNDSVRYDLNGDGIYSNHLDNNNDGVVDVKDWEIGAFIFANSYGKDWADFGFCYALYSTMALNYGEGGVSEQSGYSVDVKANYQPLLTMKVKMTHSSRGKICIKAGVSTDVSSLEPEYVMDSPIFNYQGGNHYMQGIDTANSYKTIEFGLDITPLLSHINSGQETKFFLIVNENDVQNNAEGVVQNFSVFNYNNGVQEFVSPQQNVPVANNTATIFAVTATINFSKVQISNDCLPAFAAGQPYSAQLQAEGGSSPYQWNIIKNHTTYQGNTLMPFTSQNSLNPPNPCTPSVGIALPFQFPFYGGKYDSIYINRFGFVAFRQNTYPYPYCKDEVLMMKSLKSICGAIAEHIVNNTVPECWYETSPNKVDIRWQITDSGSGLPVILNFCIRLYPSGEFEIIYGEISHANQYPLAFGVSEGNEINYQLEYERNMNQRAFTSYRYVPEKYPDNLVLSDAGVLTFENVSASDIYDITVQVNDINGISSRKTFTASEGLYIHAGYLAGADDKIAIDENAQVQITVKNTGDVALQDMNLRLTDPNGIFQLTDSTEIIPILNPGDSISLPQAFCFGLHRLLPDGFVSSLVISAQANENEWSKELPVTIASPRIELEEPYIFDCSNSLLDPGETAELIIPTINTGSVTSKGNTVELSLDDPYVSLLSPGTLFIDSLVPSIRSEQRFLVSASQNTPIEYTTTFSVSLKNNSGMDTVIYYSLKVGIPSVIIIKLDPYSTSVDSLQPILNSMQIPYKVIDFVPSNMDHIPCAFVFLGFMGAGHVLTATEGDYLSEYLTNGGNLYMEGYKTWYYNDPVAIHSLFNYNSESCSRYYFDTVNGQNSTITQGQNFSYLGQPSYAIFRITPGNGSYPLFNNVAENTECVQFAHVGTNFKAIGSMIEFGNLMSVNDSLAKIKLLKSYFDFFNVNTTNLHILFNANTTVVCPNSTVNFTDDSYDGILTRQWAFPGGSPSSSNEKEPIITYEYPGKYTVTLTISDGIDSITLDKKEYITVNDCAYIPENSEQSIILVYPNPARDFVFIKRNNNKNTFNRIELLNMQGEILLNRRIDAESTTVSLNVSKIRNGIYFLRFTGEKFAKVKKIVIW